MRISRISAMKIITHIAFWCLLKMIRLSMIIGVSMACVDGVNCSAGFWMTILTISDLFSYLGGSAILTYQKIARKNTQPIVDAFQITYTIHVYIIGFTFLLGFTGIYSSLPSLFTFAVIPVVRLTVLATIMTFIYLRNRSRTQKIAKHLEI